MSPAHYFLWVYISSSLFNVILVKGNDFFVLHVIQKGANSKITFRHLVYKYSPSYDPFVVLEDFKLKMAINLFFIISN